MNTRGRKVLILAVLVALVALTHGAPLRAEGECYDPVIWPIPLMCICQTVEEGYPSCEPEWDPYYGWVDCRLGSGWCITVWG